VEKLNRGVKYEPEDTPKRPQKTNMAFRRWNDDTLSSSLDIHGRPLSPEDLEMIRRQIEEGAEVMAAVDSEIRGIVARNWPHLLAKLPPEED
jgi:hypothetical protein